MAALSSLITPTNIITAENTLTLTNKTISGASNTLTNIPLSSAVTGTLAVANGGTGGTTQATARTGLGATTVGGNLFTLTNPSAVTFPRFNADNTVSALDAATFRSAIGAGTGSGTVTSVGATAGTGISISGSPITSSGSLTITNTGVTSVTAGTGISVSASTGGVTISASGGSSFVFLGRVVLAQNVGTATINLPASWQNTYDALWFVYRANPQNNLTAGSIIINGDTNSANYYSAWWRGGATNQQGSTLGWPMAYNSPSSGYAVSASGYIIYSGSGSNATNAGYFSGQAGQGGFSTTWNPSTVPTSISWYNDGYNSSTFYVNGTFTLYGLKNS